MNTDADSSHQGCHIPQTAVIRKDLSQAIKQVDILRRLLKVAEYAERQSADSSAALKSDTGGPQ